MNIPPPHPCAHACTCLRAYTQYADDWDKPCLISEEEEALFRRLLPAEVPGRPGVLAGGACSAAVRAARRRARCLLARAPARRLIKRCRHPSARIAN